LLSILRRSIGTSY